MAREPQGLMPRQRTWPLRCPDCGRTVASLGTVTPVKFDCNMKASDPEDRYCLIVPKEGPL
jgi:hypothetical protein